MPKAKKKDRAPIWVRFNRGGLFAAGKASEILMQRLDPSLVYRIEPVSPRNGKHHQLYWVFCTLVAHTLNEGQGGDWSAEDVSDNIKRGTGHCDVLELPEAEAARIGAKYVIRERSINFDSLDQSAFSDFFSAAMDYVLTHVCPYLMDGPHKVEIEKIATRSMSRRAA